jgi:hypothetical protein
LEDGKDGPKSRDVSTATSPTTTLNCTFMTETASANMDLKPSSRQRPRNASDASDFQLFETASMDQQQQQQHSPPLATSYEAANRKRLRSGSVSGRLRSASEYLEEKGLLDRQTKGIMKDLIIIGDEELQAAIDRYENGDPSVLEEMIQSGALQNRLPKDLDILGDLDLDFLTMDESSLLPPPAHNMMMMNMAPSSSSHSSSSRTNGAGKSRSGRSSSNYHDETAAHQLQQLHHSSCMISPDDDDGEEDDDEEEDEDEFDDDIGELDFHSDHEFDQHHDRIASDSPTPELSEHERRLRSNSLYSALINNNHSGGNTMESTSTYGRWMDPDQSTRRNRHHSTESLLPAVPAFSEPDANTSTMATRSSTKNSNKDDNDESPIKIRKKKGRRPKTASDIQESNLTKSLRDHAAETKKKLAKQQAKLEKQQAKLDKLQQQPQQQKAPRKPRKPKQQEPPEDNTAVDMEMAAAAEEPVHILGRPRSWSDPQLIVTFDEDGLRNVERPEGWVGAYSPDSRQERIRQFLTKRSLRVWTKSVKYNVRKDFANSRLRVKGRFVKKEDETLMRELMSLT